MEGSVLTHYILALSLLVVTEFFWTASLLIELRLHRGRRYLLFALLGTLVFASFGCIDLLAFAFDLGLKGFFYRVTLALINQASSGAFLLILFAFVSAFSESKAKSVSRGFIAAPLFILVGVPLFFLGAVGFDAYVFATEIVLGAVVACTFFFSIFLVLRRRGPFIWTREDWPEAFSLLFGIMLFIDLLWIVLAQSRSPSVFDVVTVAHYLMGVVYVSFMALTMLLVSARDSGMSLGPIQVMSSRIQNKLYLVYILFFSILAGFLVYIGSSQYTNRLEEKENLLVQADAAVTASVFSRYFSDLGICASQSMIFESPGRVCESAEILWTGGLSRPVSSDGWSRLEFREFLEKGLGEGSDEKLVVGVVVSVGGREVLTVRRTVDLGQMIEDVTKKSSEVTYAAVMFDLDSIPLASFSSDGEDLDLSSSYMRSTVTPIVGFDGRKLGSMKFFEPDASFRQVTSLVLLRVLSGSFLVFALMSVLVFFITLLLVNPILSLTEAAKRVASGEYGVRVKRETEDEVGQLADSFNLMAETVQAKIEELRDKDQEQRDFMAYVSHELKSPISIISWNLELFAELMDGQPELSPEQRRLISEIGDVVSRMKRLVSDLSDASQLERGIITVSLISLRLGNQVKSAVERVQGQCRAKNLEVSLSVTEDQGDMLVNADKDRLAQVLDNLLSNAIKYTGNGGRIRVAVRAEESNSGIKDRFIVEVTDSGRGIPETGQPKIFQRFFRASNASEEQTKGTGLGLFVSREIARLMGGDLHFVSKEGVGSTFTLTLPVIHESGDLRPQVG